jgi:hypothetical protein
MLIGAFCRSSPSLTEVCKPVADAKPVFNDVCEKGVIYEAVQLAFRRGWIGTADITKPQPKGAKPTSFAAIKKTSKAAIPAVPKPAAVAAKPSAKPRPKTSTPKPLTTCAGSLNMALGVYKPINRAEVAKILWNFVFREKLDRLSLPSVSTTTASNSLRGTGAVNVDKLSSDAALHAQGQETKWPPFPLT